MRKAVFLGALVLLLVAGCGNLSAPAEATDEEVVVADLALDEAILTDDTLGGAMASTADVGPLSDWPGPARRFVRRFFEEHHEELPADLPQCVDVIEGVDNDGDGVVAGFEASFHCLREPPSGNTFSFTGTLRFDDLNDQDAEERGYELTFEHFEARFEGAGRQGQNVELVRSFDGRVRVEPAFNEAGDPTSLTITKDLDFSFTRTVGDKSWTQSTHLQRTSTYTPDDPAAPFAAGTLNVEGRLDHLGGRAISVTVSTEVGLHFNRACEASPRFDAGRLVIKRYVDGVLSLTRVLTFQGCGHYTVEVIKQ